MRRSQEAGAGAPRPASHLPNKQIVHQLGTTEKTLKVHRGRVIQTLGVNSVAELVRLVDRLGRG
ncbi:LuxR C-terminal-related transcriptional regulator [Vitiosangium sp. GDMCC 1.1324]|uniref:LuxR C-terminal-related transcriptional regulator n=1 Tax=Vitiosangium sp. (strain GDMCC 1.1324) TaxID=2138576 RepID=UPI000D33D008|nr:hypothetical protein DAT35_54105 [Vitiosangium sp. GDMCC 1.1324]